MEWRDQGILLSAQQHGETSVIIDVLTPSLGRHSGVVRGGKSRKLAPALQPGAQLDLMWKARLQEHIGTFQVDLIRSRSAMVMSDRSALFGLGAVTGMLLAFLAERETNEPLFYATEQLLDLLEHPEVWPVAYLRWELGLLEILGFGLDLSTCAVTGQAYDLVFISPKTGRAVSQNAAGKWADRLLPLLPVMLGHDTEDLTEIVQSFEVLGYFFENYACQSLGLKQLPLARSRFLDTLTKTNR
ncbi:DNA repair protein RecO [Paracoccaceae bacterium]|nr:DNA repair protein RecO [Paracoccaceae bacterium]